MSTAKQTNSDFQYPGSIDGEIVPVPALGGSTSVAYTGTSAAMTSDVGTTFTDVSQNWAILRITSTSDCFMKQATTPTAVADGTCHFLPAGIPQDIRVHKDYKLAFIQLSSAGSAYITALV